LMLEEHAHAKVPMDIVISRELEIRGSHGMQAFRYGDMMAMIEKGVLKPEKLIGNLISLSEAPAALAAMDRFSGLGINVVNRF
jgi:alcohol dehydrogenase